MKILCIGNSFSVDVSTYVHQIAKAAGYDIDIYGLYIGGCPIKEHWRLLNSKEPLYEFYINGEKTPTMKCGIIDGLTYTKYDYITFQQVSSSSWDPNTYFPELPLLMEGVRKYSDAKYLLHKTWSYAKNFHNEHYGSDPLDQAAMDKDVKHAYEVVSEKVGIKNIIPSGTCISLARQKYGDILNRDGFHLNELGRTLTGILWVMYLLGRTDLDLSNFVPSGYTYEYGVEGISKEMIPELMEIAKETLKENKGHNLED